MSAKLWEWSMPSRRNAHPTAHSLRTGHLVDPGRSLPLPSAHELSRTSRGVRHSQLLRLLHLQLPVPQPQRQISLLQYNQLESRAAIIHLQGEFVSLFSHFTMQDYVVPLLGAWEGSNVSLELASKQHQQQLLLTCAHNLQGFMPLVVSGNGYHIAAGR